MGYFKIDKIDKIVISFTFIIVTLFCIFNTFSYASENIDGVVLNGLQSPNGNSGELYQSTTKGFYFPVKKNHTYTITINYDDNFDVVRLGRTSSVPSEGTYYTFLTNLSSSKKSYTITPSNDQFLYVYMYNWQVGNNVNIMSNEYIDIVDTTVGLDGAITDLFTNVGYTQLWKVFETSIPWVLVVVLFSLGVWFIKHNIIEHSKGRDF